MSNVDLFLMTILYQNISNRSFLPVYLCMEWCELVCEPALRGVVFDLFVSDADE